MGPAAELRVETVGLKERLAVRLAVQPPPTKGLLVVPVARGGVVIMAAVAVVLLKLGLPVRIWLTKMWLQILESDVTAAMVKRLQYQVPPCRMLAVAAAVSLLARMAPQGMGWAAQEVARPLLPLVLTQIGQGQLIQAAEGLVLSDP